MTKLETLKAELKAKAEATALEVAESVEELRITMKLKMLDNPAMKVARINSAITTATSNKLAELHAMCEEIVTSMPILSKKTRENYKWNPSRQYGLGNHITAITGLLSGIQYSANEHKAQMLQATGLSEDLIEQTLEAFGSTAYFNKNFNIVVDAMPYNLEAIHGNLALIEEILDVQLDKSKLTAAVMTNRATIDKTKAELALAEANSTMEVAKGTILVD